MSMEEMDQAMMDMVNGKKESDYPSVSCADSSPDKGSREERIGESPVESGTDSTEVNRMAKRFELRLRVRASVWIAICLAAAAALITALYVPAALPWIVNAGVMCFVVAAAIIADRNFWRWVV